MTFILEVASAPFVDSPVPPRPGAHTSAWKLEQPAPTIRLATCPPTRSWRVESAGKIFHVVLDGYICEPVSLDACAGSQDAATAARRLVESLERRGTEFYGHYVLCVLDATRRSVSVYRDLLGGRVAYYRVENGGLLISSSACLAARESRHPDPVYLASHFAFTSHATPGRTAFRGVREILPGERLTAGAAGIGHSRQSFTFDQRRHGPAGQDDVARFRRHLERAVGSTVGTHRRVAIMLSGGLDSASVLAMASRLARETGALITPVSWALPGFPACDESRWIRMAADHMGLEPIIFNADEQLPFGAFPHEYAGTDSPGFNAFRPLVLECYRCAAEAGCSVVLNGNKGDLLYAPPTLGVFDALSRLDFAGLTGELTWILRVKGVRRVSRDPALRYLAARMIRHRRRSAKPMEWLTPEAARSLEPEPIWPPESSAYAYPHHATHLLGGRMSFGPAQENEFARRYGIDRRDPFQDEGLARFMLSAPVSWSIHRGETKRIMRSAMDGMLPDALRLKKRTGILIPFMHAGWAKNRRKIKEMILDNLDEWSPYVDPGYMRKAVDAPDPETRDLMLACQVLGVVLWMKRLEEKPEWPA